MNRKDDKGRVLQKGETQRKDGRYVYRYTERGETKSIYAKSLTELRQKKKELEKAELNGIRYHDANKLTLNDVFDEYMRTKVGLKEITRASYIEVYNRYLRKDLGKRVISDIRYSDVKSFYLDLVKGGIQVSTLSTIQVLLHPALDLAVRNNYILNNPSDKIMSDIKKGLNWETPKRHSLTEEEQQAFMDYVKESKTYRHWLGLFVFFLGTGCRVGEVAGLTWDDVDFENGIINIKHNLIYRPKEPGTYELYMSTPKTRSGNRKIPMLSEVRKALLEEKERQIKCGGCRVVVDGFKDFVFINQNQ